MAGAGSRFAKAGYKKPKPFIDVLGKPMICHVLDNLNMPNAKFILLARKEHYNNELETVNWIKENYNVEFVLIDKLTEATRINEADIDPTPETLHEEANLVYGVGKQKDRLITILRVEYLLKRVF